MLYMQSSIEIPFLFDIRMYFVPDARLQRKLSNTKCFIQVARLLIAIMILVLFMVLQIVWLAMPPTL